MKKLLYFALLILVLILIYFSLTSSVNRPARYAVYLEPAANCSRESTVILLDSESGQSWLLNEQIWQPIDKINSEKISAGPDPELQKAFLADEINKLKGAQEREIVQIKARYEQQLNMLLRSNPQLGRRTTSSVPRLNNQPRLKKTTKPVGTAPEDKTEPRNEAAPPGWLSD